MTKPTNKLTWNKNNKYATIEKFTHHISIDQTPSARAKTSNPMNNQQETEQKILRVMTGALSVLSYPSMPLHIQNIRRFWILT